jgi:hypothetical protein
VIALYLRFSAVHGNRPWGFNLLFYIALRFIAAFGMTN